MVRNLKSLMNGLLESKNNWQATLLQGWKQIIGPLHTRVQLLKIDNETVTLGVTDACWMQELYLLSPLILKTINKNLDQPYVKKLLFKQTMKRKKRPQVERAQQERVVEYSLSSVERRVLDKIQDSALRKELQRFHSRCCKERNHEKKASPAPSLQRHTNKSGQNQAVKGSPERTGSQHRTRNRSTNR